MGRKYCDSCVYHDGYGYCVYYEENIADVEDCNAYEKDPWTPDRIRQWMGANEEDD